MDYVRQYELQCPNPDHPVEDAVFTADSAMAAFDGVTLLHQEPYPDPSPAAEAAQEGATAAVQYAAEHVGSRFGHTHIITNSFLAASAAIREVNARHGITAETVDFLNVQYAAAVGALAVLHEDVLYYGQISDCGVLVCRPDGSIIDNPITDRSIVAAYTKQVREERGWTRGEPAEHVFVRSHVVNNPGLRFEGKPVNNYVLTGQNVAIRGVRPRRLKIREPAHVITYTDGAIPLLADEALRRSIIQAGSAGEARELAEKHRRAKGHVAEATLAVAAIR